MFFEALALVGGYVATKKVLALKRSAADLFPSLTSPLAQEIEKSLHSFPEDWDLWCGHLRIKKGNKSLLLREHGTSVEINGDGNLHLSFFDRQVLKTARKGWLGWKNAQLAKEFFPSPNPLMGGN